MIYKMTVIDNGTRLRSNHSTYDSQVDTETEDIDLDSFDANDILDGDDKWTAPADGNQVKAGDVWIHVIKRNGIALERKGWTAYTHLGKSICKNLTEAPDVEPPVGYSFPVSFILENNDPAHPDNGKRGLYQFVNIIE